MHSSFPQLCFLVLAFLLTVPAAFSADGEDVPAAEVTEQIPYVFHGQHYQTAYETEHGRVSILQKFTEQSDLLQWIENYRLMIVEAEPQTFIMPNHFDADVLVFVVQGKGTASLVSQDGRESFDFDKGDIFRINAGMNVYLINRDYNETLVTANLVRPVFTTARFEAFYGAGGENPESYFRVFTKNILEAAFKIKGDRLDSLFGRQKQGVIVKISDEQMRALRQEKAGGGGSPRKSNQAGPINIYKQTPEYSNNYGQHYLVNNSQYSPLEEVQVAISLSNIAQGGMMGPYYNSRSTNIAMVVEGEGHLEMACPHLSRTAGSGSQAGSPNYELVSTGLRRGTVVVVPAGHPFVAVASNNQHLQLLSFEVLADNNRKYLLAGRGNVMKHWEAQAKEVAFGVPAREADEILESQDQEFFYPGPQQLEEGQGQGQQGGNGQEQGQLGERGRGQGQQGEERQRADVGRAYA